MEDIRGIKDKVVEQIQLEEAEGARLKAEMRVKTSVDGIPKTFWLYSKEYQKQRTERRDINGNLMGFDPSYVPPETVQAEGQRISKNSVLGGKLIQYRNNPFSYVAPKGELTVEPENNIIYSPYAGKNIIDARTGTFQISDEPIVQFRSLIKYLEQLEKKGEQDQLRNQLEAEQEGKKADLLLKQIQELETKLKSEAEEQRNYIRYSLELRMQPILDPEQETVKRSAILDGALVIDGGPGTGKTTTLIQRINFLTAPTIAEYNEELSKAEVTALDNNWRFFSPSRLLKLFLEKSISQEGLKTIDRNVKVWRDYLNEVYKSYGLFNAQTKFPFLKAHAINTPLIPNDAGFILTCKKIIEEAHVQDVRKRLSKILNMDTEGLSWSQEAARIKREVKGALNHSETLVQLIADLNRWRSSRREQINTMVTDLGKDLEKMAARVQVIVQEKKPELQNEIEEYLLEQFNNKINNKAAEEAEVDDDETIESDENYQSFNKELQLNGFYKRIVVAHAIQLLNKKLAKPKMLRLWEDKLLFAFTNLDLQEIGESQYLRRFANPFIAGAGSIVFNRIPSVYKSIRVKLVDLFKNNGYAYEAFERLVNKDRNRLHYDELNLVIWYINSLIKDLKLNSKRVYDHINHSYIQAFKEEERAVIGVDEASDFSIIEIAAIASFSDPSYNSVTLSGDLMQRMTENGIDDWSSINEILPELKVNRLSVSYRQSPTLLNLATTLYENVTGIKPDFSPHLPKSSAEPKPVVKKLEDLQNTIEWLIEQILLVYNRYETNIPSVAIFAKDDHEVVELSEQLEIADDLLDVGITVRSCTSKQELVPDAQVCVYNIENIKGLEFEAVFFVNIDQIEAADEELIQKYLYVGISRAAYYLGVSYQDQLSESLSFLGGYMDE